MSMTVQYCLQCGDRLSFIAAKNEDELQFYWAKLRRHGSVTHHGICDGCGREASVTSYLERDWVTQAA
jgi:hypothetical protein